MTELMSDDDYRVYREKHLALRKRYQRTERGYAKGTEDIVIIRAVRALVESGFVPPRLIPALDRIDVRPLKHHFGCVGGNGRMTISPKSVFYQRAREGNPLALASLLLHEQQHILHGPNTEGRAYRTQLKFLHRAGASQELIRFVERYAHSNGVQHFGPRPSSGCRFIVAI